MCSLYQARLTRGALWSLSCDRSGYPRVNGIELQHNRNIFVIATRELYGGGLQHRLVEATTHLTQVYAVRHHRGLLARRKEV